MSYFGYDRSDEKRVCVPMTVSVAAVCYSYGFQNALSASLICADAGSQKESTKYCLASTHWKVSSEFNDSVITIRLAEWRGHKKNYFSASLSLFVLSFCPLLTQIYQHLVYPVHTDSKNILCLIKPNHTCIAQFVRTPFTIQ